MIYQSLLPLGQVYWSRFVTYQLSRVCCRQTVSVCFLGFRTLTNFLFVPCHSLCLLRFIFRFWSAALIIVPDISSLQDFSICFCLRISLLSAICTLFVCPLIFVWFVVSISLRYLFLPPCLFLCSLSVPQLLAGPLVVLDGTNGSADICTVFWTMSPLVAANVAASKNVLRAIKTELLCWALNMGTEDDKLGVADVESLYKGTGWTVSSSGWAFVAVRRIGGSGTTCKPIVALDVCKCRPEASDDGTTCSSFFGSR